MRISGCLRTQGGISLHPSIAPTLHSPLFSSPKLPFEPPNPEVCGGVLNSPSTCCSAPLLHHSPLYPPQTPRRGGFPAAPAHLRRVGRLLGGQHGVGAVFPREVTHDANRPPVLNAKQPQRFAVPGTAGRTGRNRRNGRWERRSGSGRARRGIGGTGGQTELPDDVDDVPEGAVGAEEALRDRFAALRAAEPPRGVLPALRHAGPAEIMAAFRHQHRIGEVFQAHRAGELVLKAPSGAARSGRDGGGSGRGLHRRSELRGEVRTAPRRRPD